MNVKYQVFISSTYLDLKEERDIVIKSILEMGHIPVGMEMFSAGDEEQWQIIKKQIDDCDYYIVIVANRYGSMDKGISYTEKEYDYAKSKGIPTLGFIIDGKANWPLDKSDNDNIKKEKLDQFKNKVSNKLVGFWQNKEDLYAKVCIALMKQFTVNPGVGWIRADEGVNIQVTQEISRLSKENSDLRKEIENLRIEEQNEEINKINDTIGILKNRKIVLSYFYKFSKDWEKGKEISLERVFNIIAPEILTENSADYLNYLVALMTQHPDKTLREKHPLPTNVFNVHLGDLQAMGLIEPSKIKHSVKDQNDYWTISSYGKEVHKEIRLRSIIKEIEKNKNTSGEEE